MLTIGGRESIIAVSILAFALNAMAADREGFFKPNSARDVLPDAVLDSEIQGIEFFRKVSKPVEEEPLPEVQNVNIKLQATQSKNDAPKSKEEIAQAILVKYGNPTEDVPILAKDDAPAAFKAMMEAKEAGLDELAFQYAKQQVRFIENTKDRTMYITGLLGQAQVDEGVLPESSWINSPQFEEQKRLLEKERARRAQEGDGEFDPEAIETKSLDEKARELLAQATSSEDYGALNAAPEQSKPVLDEKLERQKLQTILRGRVPAAADGKIDIYLFARINDKNTFETLRAFDELYRSYSADSRLHFIGFTPDASAVADLENFRAWNKLAFPYRVGSDTAKALGVKRSPTLIFAARSSGEFIKEEGPRAFYVMEEILKAMQGAR